MRGTFTISGTASDALSGVDYVDVEIFDQTSSSSAKTVSPVFVSGADWSISLAQSDLADGYYFIRVRAHDKASNTLLSTIPNSSLRIHVDNVVPVITLASHIAAQNGALWNNTSPVTITWACNDPAPSSGINAGASHTSDTYSVEGYATSTGLCVDNSGNSSTATEGVKIDKTKPAITILGANPLTWEALMTYVDPGATSSDALSGILGSIATSSNVNINLLGVYWFNYDVSDIAGNAATTAIRIVNVVDTTKPVITITGGVSELFVNESYSDAGATALDNYYGDITSSIVASGSVDASKVGTYSITYNVADASGNAADPATRTVKVKATGNGPQEYGVGPSIFASTGGGGGSSTGSGQAGGGSVLGASVSVNGPTNDIFPLWSKQSGFLANDTLAKLLGGYRIAPSGGIVAGISTVTPNTGDANPKFAFTKNLKQGIKNTDVTELQNILISLGFLKGTNATGYFGPLTRGAVVAYQKAHNIVPAVGFVGPLTRADLNK